MLSCPVLLPISSEILLPTDAFCLLESTRLDELRAPPYMTKMADGPDSDRGRIGTRDRQRGVRNRSHITQREARSASVSSFERLGFAAPQANLLSVLLEGFAQ